MIKTIKKLTFKFRYGLVYSLMRLLTPSVWRALTEFRIFNKYPRPSIEFIRNHTDSKKLIGAEIGVYTGEHSKNILETLLIEKLYMVDIWKNYSSPDHPQKINIENYYHKIVAKYKDDSHIEILRMRSMDALSHVADNSLDFVYIDASHEYNDVIDDLEGWSKKVKIGGVVCGHDIGRINDVQKAVFDFGKKYDLNIQYGSPDFYFIKPLSISVNGFCGQVDYTEPTLNISETLHPKQNKILSEEK